MAQRLFVGGLPVAGLIGRWKDALIHRARLSNEPVSFQFRFRDKSYDFAHMSSKFYKRSCAKRCEYRASP